MKKVAFLKSAPLFPVQGADVSMFERMLLLRGKGWEGMLISTGQIAHLSSFEKILANLSLPGEFDPDRKELRFEHLGVPCRMRLAERADQFTARSTDDVFPLFDEALEELNPDFCFGNLRDPLAVEYLGKSAKPHLIFLTEDGYPRKGQPDHEGFMARLEKVRRIAVSSEYISKTFFEACGRRAELFTNTIATSLYKIRKETQGDFITLVHPYTHKGVEPFLQLVRTMADRKFMVLAGTGADYRKRKQELLSYPNLTLAAFTPQITQVYRQSRIVLVPSLCQDVFPRVVVEALCSGTPVIASGTGGMRDGGGDAAFYEPIERRPQDKGSFQLDGWIKRIEQLDDKDFYSQTCQKIRRHVEAFEQKLRESMTKLAALMDSETGRQPAA